MLKPDSVLTYIVFLANDNSFKMVTLLNTYNLVSVHVFTIDLTYYFVLHFLGDERELLNALLFRQIHTLQGLPGIVVFRGHVYGIAYMYMFPMLKISVDVYDLPINRLHHTF
jgi:hypothetical protein